MKTICILALILAAASAQAAGLDLIQTTGGGERSSNAWNKVNANLLYLEGLETNLFQYVYATNGTNLVVSGAGCKTQNLICTNSVVITLADPRPGKDLLVLLDANGGSRNIWLTTNLHFLSTNGWGLSGAYWTNLLPSGKTMAVGINFGRATNVSDAYVGATIEER